MQALNNSAGKQPIWALIPASGKGQRMGSDIPKQYLKIAGKTVIEHTLERVLACPSVDQLLLAIAPDDEHWHKLGFEHPKLYQVVTGDVDRSGSVMKLLQTMHSAAPTAWALVHDAVRPCVRARDIEGLIAAAKDRQQGGLLAAPITDTVKRDVDQGEAQGGAQKLAIQMVESTVPRAHLWRAFTPQIFVAEQLLEALQNHPGCSDEAAAIEGTGGDVFLYEGSPDNIKITRPEDLPLAELILNAQNPKHNLPS